MAKGDEKIVYKRLTRPYICLGWLVNIARGAHKTAGLESHR